MASTDLQLLRQYADGRDAEAFAELVTRHRDMVYATCSRVLTNPADAEDSTQECFLRLASHAGSIKTSVAGWLHRVAVHTSVSLQRRDRTRRKTEWKAATTLTEGTQEASWSKIKVEIDRAIDGLPDRLREPLVLHFLEGRPQTAIAEELSVSQSAVSRRVKKGVEKLRRHLAKAGLPVSIAGLACVLEGQVAEAAPATLVAELGKIGLAGVGSGSSGASAGSVLGLGLITGANAKIACVAATALTVAAVVQYTAQEHAVARQPTTSSQSAAVQRIASGSTGGEAVAARPPDADVRTAAPQATAPTKTAPTEYRVTANTARPAHGERVAVRPRSRGLASPPKPLSPEPTVSPASTEPSSTGVAVTAPSPAAEKRPDLSPVTRVGQAAEAAGPEAAADEQDAMAESPGLDRTGSLAALAPQSPVFFFAQPRQPPLGDREGVWIDFRTGEESQGLQFMDGFQCSRKVADIDGVGCAQTTPPGGMYLLFEASRDMIMADRDTLTFDVEVYDGDPHRFMLEVESATPALAIGGRAFRVVSTVQRTGTPKWRWVRWQVTDPAFCDPARDAIRFRFYDEAWWNDGRLLSISQVRVTHEALVFRPEEDAVLCGDRLPVTVQGHDKSGQPLPDGTEVELAYEPASALTERPLSVTLNGGEAGFEVVAGPKPETVLLCGLPAGGQAWARKPVSILAGQGELEERTDLVTGEELAATARFASPALAESSISTFTDDQGQVALRGTCVWKPEVTPGDTRLVLDVPISGLPRRFRVYLGCPDQSVDCVWARIRDRTGELFSYYIEPREDGHALEYWIESCLECQALAGPSYFEGRGTPDSIIDLPCSLYALDIVPMAGCWEAEIDVWGIETDVLAPPLEPADEAAGEDQP